MSEDHTYEFNVTMSCGGCSGAIKRVLGKLDGVKSYTATHEDNSVTVIAEPDLSYEKVLETIRNTRKTINEGKADGKVMSVELPAKEGGVLDL